MKNILSRVKEGNIFYHFWNVLNSPTEVSEAKEEESNFSFQILDLFSELKVSKL